MKQSIRIYFQEGDGKSRPDDASLTTEPLPPVSSLAEVPLVGDYIEFSTQTGDEGVYRVISRLLTYKRKEDQVTIFANVVLERQSDDIYGKLVKQ